MDVNEELLRGAGVGWGQGGFEQRSGVIVKIQSERRIEVFVKCFYRDNGLTS